MKLPPSQISNMMSPHQTQILLIIKEINLVVYMYMIIIKVNIYLMTTYGRIIFLKIDVQLLMFILKIKILVLKRLNIL